jgi:hypothetical protein
MLLFFMPNSMYDAPPESPFEMEEPAAQGSNPIGGITDALRAHGKTIIIILILAVAAFLVYDYFIGSQVKVTISAKDTEGKLLATIPGKLFESGSSSPMQSFEGTTTLGLRPGTYRVEWDASDTSYVAPDPLDFSIEKTAGGSSGDQDQTTVFAKDLGITLTRVQFPTTIVRGQQNAKGTISLRNDSTQAQSVDILFEGGLAPLADSITLNPPAPVLVPGKGTLDVQLSLSVPDTFPVNSKNSGDKKSGSIRVKYTSEKQSVDFTAFDKFSFDLNPTQTVSLNAKADELKTTRYTLRNKATNDSTEKIDAEIVITQSDGTNDTTEIQKWFTWSIDKPFKALAKGESISPELRFRAPISAQKDLIQGKVRFFTSFWEGEAPFTINLAEAVVDVVGTLDAQINKTYTLSKDATNPAIYETKNATLKIENKSGFPISTVLYQVSTGCENYISLISPDFFPINNLSEKGKPNATQSTQVKITAPSTALPGAKQDCTITLTYEDPRTHEPVDMTPITVEITPSA